MKIEVNTKHYKILESLSSLTRIRILELLSENPKNIGELALELGVSSAITTRHISMLEEAGIVLSQTVPGKRGLQKICSLASNEITLTFKKESAAIDYRNVSIPIGQYIHYKIAPNCGLASPEGPIGIHDDPRYFSDPEHVNASILWFQTGWVEYRIPSYIISTQSLNAIEISLEICSEFPAHREDWPSDIHFYLNDVLLGVWTCPGDFGDRKGIYTPDWWGKNMTQYGLLKTLRVTHDGTMLDGISLSDTTLRQVLGNNYGDMYLKIACPSESRNPGGINILGKGFGNHNQDIEVRAIYD